MAATRIEWTETTWNPTTGCDRVSPGCDHCYALTLAKRLKSMGSPRYQRDGDPRTSGPGFGLTAHDDALKLPLKWRKPRRVFVNSMSDLFHREVPDAFIAYVFGTMSLASRHTFQVLTKRPQRMAKLLAHPEFLVRMDDWRGASAGDFVWPLPNVWLGVSVENQRYADLRIPHLLATPAAVRFLSCEPLLGPIQLDRHIGHPRLTSDGKSWASFDESAPLDWVIVGGESGHGARPMDPEWARSIRDQCVAAGVPFFFKQHGGRTPKAGGRDLDGRTWDEYPEHVA